MGWHYPEYDPRVDGIGHEDYRPDPSEFAEEEFERKRKRDYPRGYGPPDTDENGPDPDLESLEESDDPERFLHPDDFTGRLLREHAQENWDHVCLPALGRDEGGVRIADDINGTPLWPERWPLDELLKKRRNEYEWLSKFQQSPSKRGGNLFKGVSFYDPREFRGRYRPQWENHSCHNRPHYFCSRLHPGCPIDR